MTKILSPQQAIKLYAMQLTSSPDVDENLANIEQILLSNIGLEPQAHILKLVVLPECCLYFGGSEHGQLTLAKQHQHGQYLPQQLARLAQKFQLYLVAGTIPLLNKTGDKFTNTSLVFSPTGECLANYHKIHLFDVIVADSEKNYCESKQTQAGEQLTTFTLTDEIPVGLSVCYDLRFPELYRALRHLKSHIITLPSAFTKVTGAAHWQALLQARAIENQCYVIAANQQGKHANGRETWGHSMIISPWGDILNTIAEGQGLICADYNPQLLAQIRTDIPVHHHNQFTVELKN